MVKKIERKPLKVLLADPKVREKLVPIAVVVIVGLGSFLFGSQLLAGIYQKQGQIKVESRKVSVLEDKVNTLTGTSEAALQSQVVVLESVLPSYKPALTLLASLSSLARDEKVVLSEITLNPGKVEEFAEKAEAKVERSKRKVVAPPAQDFTLEFSAEGGLREIGNFITGLEKTAPVMKVEKFSLSLSSRQTSAAGGRPDKVKITLSVKVFHQKPPETLGEVDTPLVTLSQEEVSLLQKLTEFSISPPIQPLAPVGKSDLFTP